MTWHGSDVTVLPRYCVNISTVPAGTVDVTVRFDVATSSSTAIIATILATSLYSLRRLRMNRLNDLLSRCSYTLEFVRVQILCSARESSVVLRHLWVRSHYLRWALCVRFARADRQADAWRSQRVPVSVRPSVRSSVHSSVTKDVNTMFWKRMRFWC